MVLVHPVLAKNDTFISMHDINLSGEGSQTVLAMAEGPYAPGSFFSTLSDPLQAVMLPMLKAQNLAALRRTCKAGQQLIDEASIQHIRPCEKGLVPLSVLKRAQDSLALQEALWTEVRHPTPWPKLSTVKLPLGRGLCVVWLVGPPHEHSYQKALQGGAKLLEATKLQSSVAWVP